MTKMNKFDITIFIIYCLSSGVFVLIFLLFAVLLRRHGYEYYGVIPVTYVVSAVLFWLVSLYMDD